MPKCIICGDKFYYQSHMDPAEPCDCGNCITSEDAKDLSYEELDRLDKKYKTECEEGES